MEPEFLKPSPVPPNPYAPPTDWRSRPPDGIRPPRRPSGFLRAVAIGLAILAVGGAIVAYRAARRPKPRPPESIQQKYSEMQRAFSTTNPADVDEAAAIKAALDAYAAAIRRNDVNAAVELLDTERMIDEMRSLGLLGPLSRQNRADLAGGFQAGMRKSLSQPFNGLRVTGVEIKNIRSLGATDALVYLRATHEVIPGKLKFRWWVCKRMGRWRIYDHEDLDSGIRLTNAMGMALAGSGSSPQIAPWVNHGPKLQQAMQALAQQDLDGCQKLINELEQVPFPPPIRAIVLMFKGILLNARGEREKCLELCEQAEKLNPDLPMVFLIRSRAHNGLGQYDKAITNAQRYLDLLGDDAPALAELGQAYEALEKGDQALSCFRRGFADDPSEVANFYGLARLLPASGAKELADALGKCADSKAAFKEAVTVVYEPGKLEPLVQAYRKLHGADAEWAYNEARVKMLRKQPAEAMGILKQAMSKATGETREKLENLFVSAAISAKKYQEAYGIFPDKEVGFRRVCGSLWGQEDAADLQAFIEANEKDLPRSPWPLFYRGRLGETRNDLPAAVRFYESAWGRWKKQDEKDNDGFLAMSYARCCFKAGQAVDALTRVAPARRETLFDLLSFYAFDAKDAATLEQLIAAQRKPVPGCPALGLNDLRLLFLKKDYAAMAGLPKDRVDPLLASQDSAAEAQELLVRALVRTNRLAEIKPLLQRVKEDHRETMTEILAAAAAGDAAAIEKAMQYYVEDEGELQDLYADEDFARLIESPAMAAVRKKYPRPATQPAVEAPQEGE